MREEEFRSWLEGRTWEGGPITTAGHRLSRANRFERAMGELGLGWPDLDAAYDDDRLQGVFAAFRRWRAAAKKGELLPECLIGNSQKPLGLLAGLRAAVGNYREFLDDLADRNDAAPEGLTRAAVEAAMDECDEIGEAEFHRRHGTTGGRANRVYRDDDTYPAKAVANAAWLRDHGEANKFDGYAARRALEALQYLVESDADTIRRHVLETYIQPALHEGLASVEVRVRDVNAALELNQAWPNICQAVTGRRFLETTGLPAPERIGADMSSATVFRFKLAPRDGESARPAMPGGCSREPTNLILYGPPGTGKTYRTAEEALKLCGEPVPDNRTELMQRFHALRKDRRIEFVTFHQNFAYEDFVEGLRPPASKGEGGESEAASSGLRLDIHPGVFQDLCQRARLDRGTSAATSLDPQRSVFKIALGARGQEEEGIKDALDSGEIRLGWGQDLDWSDPIFENFNAILERWRREKDPDASGKDSNVEQMFALRSWMQEGDYVVVSDGRDRFRALGQITGPYFYCADVEGCWHRRKVKWLWRSDSGLEREIFYPKFFRRHSLYRLDPNAIDWAALASLVDQGPKSSTDSGPRHYVLIIDEINRANVSKVFGELITLIEPDKRLGMENALEVRLPYSKRPFGVPANLHIIGTMNTADRSIALLDTALRRRFRFEEIAPEPELLRRDVDGVNLQAVLTAINERIEYLIDRDHRIGHAFFMGCQSRDAIHAVMRNKVIPLLQEYFFDDWGRIAAVVGEGFLMKSTLNPPPGLKDHGGRKERWAVRKEFLSNAYDLLLGGATVAAQEPVQNVLDEEQASEDLPA